MEAIEGTPALMKAPMLDPTKNPQGIQHNNNNHQNHHNIMAETLTMESNVETTSIDNLSAEEQDSLQVGEQMQEAQDNY